MKFVLTILTALLTNWALAQDKYIVAGDRYMDKGEYLEALEKYKIAHIYNEDYLSTVKIARCNFVLQRFVEAEKWYRTSLTFPQSSVADEIEIVKCLIITGKIDESRLLLEQIQRKFPDDKFSRLLLKYIQFQLNGQIQAVRGSERNVDYCVELQAVEDSSMLGPDVQIEWHFDDGTYIRGNKVSHCFKTPGKHSVTLSSIDKTFDNTVRTDTVLPIFFLEAMNFEVVGLAWTNASIKLDGRKLAYRPNIVGVIWETGDGEISMDEVFTYKYLRPGNYAITLTLIAEDGGNWYPAGSLRRLWKVADR